MSTSTVMPYHHIRPETVAGEDGITRVRCRSCKVRIAAQARGDGKPHWHHEPTRRPLGEIA